MFSPSSAMSWGYHTIFPLTNTQGEEDSHPHPSNANNDNAAVDDADDDAIDDDADNDADINADNNNAMQRTDKDADATQHRQRTTMQTMMPPPRQQAKMQTTAMQPRHQCCNEDNMVTQQPAGKGAREAMAQQGGNGSGHGCG